MTGVTDLGASAFDDAAERLRALGHEVFSPVEMDRQLGWVFEDNGTVTVTEEFDYETAMALDFEAIEKADGIVCLEGFAKSPGAIRELHHALTCGKQVFYAYDWSAAQPLKRIS